ncbi:MAG TPA: hypothetical protein VFA65_16530 [Bryobacteraceae bacterium]|nr:hypothetical protein [Bryobacteraceae bacterium]
MPDKHVPLNEVAIAVQNAVQQTLAKHGAVSVDKLWVGFVAPDNVATQENAAKLATELAREAGISAQPSVAQLAPAAAGAKTEAHATVPKPPGHIIGLVFSPKLTK